MKKEYLITYSIHDDIQQDRFELLMGVGFEQIRKKHYKTVKYYEIKSNDDEKEMERKIRLVADEIIWGKDDELEILNLSIGPKISNLRYTDEERIIIKGDTKLEEKVIQWMEMFFWTKQVEDNYFKNLKNK
jgi:hypothetical protein